MHHRFLEESDKYYATYFGNQESAEFCRENNPRESVDFDCVWAIWAISAII